MAQGHILGYTIRFENRSHATAPVQKATITHPLDPDPDFRTFRLGQFGWGGFVVDVPQNTPFYFGRLDRRADLGLFVDVAAGIDVATGEAFWTFTAIDPATGEMPTDATLGFLPPNDETHRGEGFASYIVRAKQTVASRSRIDAQARIVFDTEAPIDTPPIFNTIDAVAPSSQVASLLPGQGGSEFLVQ